jgi:hypothetical protein
MSGEKNDAKAYRDWFKERNVTPVDIAINSTRLNIKLKTDDTDNIINAIKLEGTPDVDIIKVFLPFLSSEKTGIQDNEEDEHEQKEENQVDEPQNVELEQDKLDEIPETTNAMDKLKVDDDGDGFETTYH